MNNQTARPAFGEIVAVGTLYDAKTDKFLSRSILKGELAPSVIAREKLGRNDPCPCGSGRRFRAMLPLGGSLRRQPRALLRARVRTRASRGRSNAPARLH